MSEKLSAYKPVKTTTTDRVERVDQLEHVLKRMLMCIWRQGEIGYCHQSSEGGYPECEYFGSSTPCYQIFERELADCGVRV